MNYFKAVVSFTLIFSLLTPFSANAAETNERNINQSNYIESSQSSKSGVIISNESTSYTLQSTGKFSINELNKKITKDDALPQEAYQIDLLPKFNPEEEQAPLFSKSAKSAQSFSVGSMKKFWVINAINDKDYQIEAVLKYSGKHGEIWVHDDEISGDQAKEMSDEFDREIYPLITENFAEESDVDQNKKVSILVYDIKDGFNGFGGYIGGYFYARDLYDVTYSNRSEVFYIDTYPSMGQKGSYDVSRSFSTLAHEFQHMVNYNQNVLIEGGTDMETWLNEALSMAAEHMYLDGALSDRIQYYEASRSIEKGHSLLHWEYYGDVLSNYSLSYLFGQYLRVQSGQGESIYKELLENPKSANGALRDIIQKYIHHNKSLGEFLTDFRHALYMNEPSGLYGFKGEEALSEIESSEYRGKLPINLSGGGAVNVPVADLESFIPPASKGRSIVYRNPFEKTIRIAGPDRYETAVDISREGWKTSKTVVLATGSDFPDALAGGPLAYKEQAPILLTRPTSLHVSTEEEIERLKAKKVIILGSKSAVSSEIEKKLENKGLEVVRIGGKTRFDTAALIAKRLPSDQTVVANGLNFPDVLAVSPYAAKNGIPILLTRTDNAPAETLNALKGKKNSIVVGSTGAISNNVMKQFPNPVRYGGATRYDTAKEIITKLSLGTEKAYVSTGANFPDALAGSVMAANQNAPILLVRPNEIPKATKDLLSKYHDFTILGSTGAVSDQVRKELDRSLNNN